MVILWWSHKVRKDKGLKSAHVSEFDTETSGTNTGHKRATGNC